MIVIHIIFALNIILNLLSVIRRKNSKLICVISYVSLIIIMGLNSFNSDYNVYLFHYNSNIIGEAMEPGFSALASIAHYFGLPYAWFIFLFLTGCITVGVIATRKVSCNYHAVILAYMTTAMFLNTDEVRQTAAYVFYALGLVSLQEGRKGKAKYCFFVLLAASMQISSIILLPFPYVKNIALAGRKILGLCFAGIMVMCIAVFLNGNRIPYLYEIASAVLPQSKMIYFDTHTNLGFIKYFLGNALNLLISIYGAREINSHPNMYGVADRKFAQNLYYSILYISFAMPLCMVNGEFFRYFRFSVFPCIMLISILLNKKYYIHESRKHITGVGLMMGDYLLLVYVILYQILFQHFRVVGEVLNNSQLDKYIKITVFRLAFVWNGLG